MEPEGRSPRLPPPVSFGGQNETASISSPPTFAVPSSIASPFPERAPFSPLLGFEPFESQPESNLEPAAGEILSGVPQPLEALYETPVPPFLSKTFDLVEDPSLDAIISWGATGESFVVWDPIEFARTVLPRNFKHSNFSSFVRQLNTYGFRKVDTDKWEFANEGFKKGQRHMLKNIQRRKSHQPIGSSSGSSHDPNRAAVEVEIEHLRNERSLMMQEMVELQHHQRGTVQHMEIVNEKLQLAERRQKQMVSFLGKIFQNPAFLARLQQRKEQKTIVSPRTMRKFLKHQPRETGSSGSSRKGQVFKYPLLEMGKSTVLGTDSTQNVPFQVEDVVNDELAMMHESLDAPEKDVMDLAQETLGHDFKGKGVTGHQAQQGLDYLISFPDSLGKEVAFSEVGVSVSESMAIEEGIWGMGFETGIEKSSLSNELWGNVTDYNMQELDGLSNIWGIGPMPLAGSSSVERWVDEDSPFNELENKETQDKE